MSGNIEPEIFFNACLKGDYAIVQTYIDEGRYDLDLKSKEGWTGLVMACFNENIEVAKLLIRSGADINATNHKGTTVFMYAKTPIQKKPEETGFLQYLLDHGADINALDHKKKSVLDYVIENECPSLAKWLKSKGAETGINLVQK